jgi:hypothetical protein
MKLSLLWRSCQLSQQPVNDRESRVTGAKRDHDHLVAVKLGCFRASHVLPQALEKRMPDLSLGGFRPVLDFGQQLRFNPERLVRDLFGIRLRFAD